MVKSILQFMREEEGTTAVEYGLMLALIGVLIIAAVQGLGNTLAARFNAVGNLIAAS